LLLGGNFNPPHITQMPAVNISGRLKLDEDILFLDGHQSCRPLDGFLSAIRRVKAAGSLTLAGIDKKVNPQFTMAGPAP
jgi:hypothetical protein